MNQLYGVSLNKMAVRDLRLTIGALNHDAKASTWSKKKCIDWLNTRLEDPPRQVSHLCKILLRVVVGKNDEGFPVGLSYPTMFQIVKNHFPNSAINERHFSWYATTMRAAGETIPVYRE